VAEPEPDRPQLADFASFMRAYQDMVFSTAARMTANDAQAEDIAQEVFLKAYENFSHLRGNPSAGGWLKAVARNLTLNHLSRYRKRWRLFSELRNDDGDEDEPIDFPLPDSALDDIQAGERHKLVEEALKHLPDHHRVPLVLYHFEEMPYEEIAATLGISLAKVKTDIFRARTALAKALAGSGVATELAEG
jgi:RNA polymerase sigma-70 factor, ECF subfamily